MLMDGPITIDRMAGCGGWTGWVEPVKWLLKNHVRVICSKHRMNRIHPLIAELRREGVSVTMVRFKPGQDGYFLFLGPVGPVTGNGVETHRLNASPSVIPKYYPALPDTAVHWVQLGEEVEDCKTKLVLLTETSSDGSYEEDENPKPRKIPRRNDGH